MKKLLAILSGIVFIAPGVGISVVSCDSHTESITDFSNKWVDLDFRLDTHRTAQTLAQLTTDFKANFATANDLTKDQKTFISNHLGAFHVAFYDANSKVVSSNDAITTISRAQIYTDDTTLNFRCDSGIKDIKTTVGNLHEIQTVVFANPVDVGIVNVDDANWKLELRDALKLAIRHSSWGTSGVNENNFTFTLPENLDIKALASNPIIEGVQVTSSSPLISGSSATEGTSQTAVFDVRVNFTITHHLGTDSYQVQDHQLTIQRTGFAKADFTPQTAGFYSDLNLAFTHVGAPDEQADRSLGINFLRTNPDDPQNPLFNLQHTIAADNNYIIAHEQELNYQPGNYFIYIIGLHDQSDHYLLDNDNKIALQWEFVFVNCALIDGQVQLVFDKQDSYNITNDTFSANSYYFTEQFL